MEMLPRNHGDAMAVCKAYLNDNTTTTKFGDKTFEFIQLNIIDKIASGSNIKDNLDSFKFDTIAMNRLKEMIYTGSVRLFALAIYCDVSLPDLNILIKDYSDEDLPFPPDHQLGKTGELSGAIFETIRNSQDRFLAPYFREKQYRDDFTDCPIPVEFTKGTKPDIGEGSGGRVYKARIRYSHFYFSRKGQLYDGWSNNFALKVSKFRKDAERERDFLESLAEHEVTHEHITTFYTGFVFEQNIYLIAELADSNLDEFMEKYPERRAVGDLDREWLLAQLNGLAGALFTIHNMIRYHHDIKPTNILVFNDPSADVKHRLKFTDFGSAGNGMSSSPTGSSTKSKVRGTTPMLLPEAHNNGFSSRPHDDWSLGCVFLDLLMWYHTGWENVKEFRSKVMEESEAWCYYDVIDEKKVVTGRVSTALDELAQVEGELVGVIREMLEIDPGSRLKAARVFDRLWKMVEQLM